MNPIAICEQVSGKIVGYACEKCGLMATLATFGGGTGGTALRMAAECCVPKTCAKHDRPIDSGWTICQSCRSESDAAKEAARFEKATKVELTDYKGDWLFSDGFPNEGYQRVEDMDDYDHEDDNPIDYAWGCKRSKVSFDLADCLESHIHDNCYEDAFEAVDRAKLEEASKLVLEACGAIEGVDVDYSVAVILPKEAV